MKIREHRGMLADAMKTVKDIEPTTEAVACFLNTAKENIKVEPYGFDNRIGWNTYVVTDRGNGVAFTDGPLND